MRLSDNPLVRGVSTCYVEIFRNVPLLLQIFFWYTAILKPLPTPRAIYEKGQEVFLGITNRGLHIPAPETEASFTWVWVLFLLGVVVTFFVARFAKKRRLATGKDFPILTFERGAYYRLACPCLCRSGESSHADFFSDGQFPARGRHHGHP